MTQRSGGVLVTGAAGFVGAWLCRKLLDAGAAVTGTVRHAPGPGSLFERLGLQGAVTLVTDARPPTREFVAALRPGRVFNLAGQAEARVALADPGASFEANAAYVWRLLDALRFGAPDACIVHASTDGVYGEAGADAATEDTPLRATGPYEASKAAGDLAARSYAAAYGMNVTVARLGNVYGPGDPHRSRLVPSLVDALAAGRAPALRTATAVRSYVHVDDATDALVLLAARAGEAGVRGAAFNVTSTAFHSTLEVARLAAAACGRPDLAPVVEGNAGGELSVKRSSPDRIAARLGWRARVGLRDGLAMLVRHPVESGR